MCDQTSSLARLFVPFALVSVSVSLSADPLPVRHREGTAHGFVVLRSPEGKILAAGDAIQTVDGDRVSSELDLHFEDGSIQEEHTEFMQHRVFKLLRDHLQQQGPSFPSPVDTLIDTSTAQVSVRGKDGKTKETHLSMPDDVANGLLTTIIKDLSPGAKTTVSYVITTPKPQVVKLEISPLGEDEFSAAGAPHKALHLVGHVHIGGVMGVLASATGKEPADFHYWIATGAAPTFLRYHGPLFEGGPLWSIELAAPRPEQKHASRQ